MIQKLSSRFETMIKNALPAQRELAQDVLRLSDFYIHNPGQPTPWREAFALPAYLSYFLPLNYARLASIFREVERFLPSESIRQIWDFGSGLGTTQWVLEDEGWLEPRSLYCLESAPAAVEEHLKLCRSFTHAWTPQFAQKPKPEAGALAVFSYSFLEMRQTAPDLKAFSHVLIVEPSTRDCGRALMEVRSRLLEQGFHALAPCTHALGCPLLEHSERDWCHQRVGFEPPGWWLELENQLPMKNRTLTYSYLLMSQTIHDSEWRHSARAIGDTLSEKGKTRQMICRGPKREFLSWLHRHGPPTPIPRGSLIQGVDTCVEKGSELRFLPEQSELSWTEPDALTSADIPTASP